MARLDIVEIHQRWSYLNYISLLFPWFRESKSTKITNLNRESLMIEWIWPLAFSLLPLPWLVRRFLREAKQDRPALLVPSLGPFVGSVKDEVAEWKHLNLKLLLLWLIWVSLIVALARPQWTGDPITLPTTGRDLMLAVDISGSMATEDMMINGEYVDRLTAVKLVVSDFVSRRIGDRVGLILFGTNAYLQAPLTFDLKTLDRFLLEAPVGIAGGKTAIGDAIGLAVKRLRQRPQQDKVIILLTDGANNVGEVEPRKASELAANDKIKIYTIGVGADEMRLPSIFGAFGNRVTNPSADLDERTLTEIAETTSGAYFRAKDPVKLAEIYNLIDELEPADQEAEVFRPRKALSFWALSAAILAAFAFFLIDLYRRPIAQQE